MTTGYFLGEDSYGVDYLGIDALLGSPDYLGAELLGCDPAGNDPLMGGFFSKIGKAIGKVASGAAKGIGKIPIVGGGLKGAFNLTVGAPFSLASKVMQGQRIDKAFVGHLKDQVTAIKDVAPYVTTVVSLVPGVGTSISGAIGAGLALAQGKPITQALLEAAKSAIPGGALAKSAFDLGSAAIQGKPIDKALLSALPIPDAAKQALEKGLGVAKGIAHGERIDAALLDVAIKALPPEAQKAVTTGLALGHGQVLQSIKAAGAMPAVTRFAGGTALAIGAGSARTGLDVVNRVVAGAKSGDPKKVAAAQSVVRTTIAMSKMGTPLQRKAALNGLAVLRNVSTAAGKANGKKEPSRAVRKGWHVDLSGRVTPT
jgi:hypothetical protein